MSRVLPSPDASAVSDLREEARAAGLRYVSDDRPGITRHRSGRGFSYRSTSGETIRDRAEIARIASIAIPPAWSQVWICPNPRGHILATGRDARKRKQYRYHPDWRSLRDATKFDRMSAFSTALPAIRSRLQGDLALRGLPREQVLAAVVSIIDRTLIRVGNEEYARQNRSFGATTLRDEHAEIVRDELRLSFRGKAGKEHEAAISDPRLTRWCGAARSSRASSSSATSTRPGRRARSTRATSTTTCARSRARRSRSRTSAPGGGSVLCHQLLLDAGAASDETEAKTMLVASIKIVAARLGNTPAVCRASYVHPGILEVYVAGELASDRGEASEDEDGLRPEEQQLQAFLSARSVD